MRFKIVLFLISFGALFAQTGFSQSFFKSMPKVAQVQKAHVFSMTLAPTALPDSFTNAFRPIVGVAAFSEPGNQLMTGAGVSYQHLKWDYSAQKWQSEWSVSGLAWAAGSVSPGPQTPAFAAGPALGLFNNLILVGGAYDFTHKQWIAVLSLGISLNN